MKRLHIYLLIYYGLLCACGSGNHPLGSSTVKGNDNQLSAALAVVSKIDYLPYDFKYSGCETRAFYVGIELALEKIPSNQIFIFGSFAPFPSFHWGYHVATAIRGESDEPVVLDPTFQRQELSVTEWIEKTRPTNETYLKIYTDGNRLMELTNTQKTPTKSMSELNSFRLDDIILACQTIYRIYGDSSFKQTEPKKQLLITRTKQIVMRLWEMKKLDFSLRPNRHPLFDQSLQKAGSERIGQMAAEICSGSVSLL